MRDHAGNDPAAPLKDSQNGRTGRPAGPSVAILAQVLLWGFVTSLVTFLLCGAGGLCIHNLAQILCFTSVPPEGEAYHTIQLLIVPCLASKIISLPLAILILNLVDNNMALHLPIMDM